MNAVWPAGQRCAVSLCFDDADPSQLEHAVPALDARGLKATFYLNSGRLQAEDAETRARTWPGWVRAREEGHELGNHTRHHPCSTNFAWTVGEPCPPLEELSLEGIEDEIVEAQRFIERELGTLPRTFAYPCGMAFVGRGLERRSYVPLVARHFVVGRGFNAEVAAHPQRCDLAHVPALSMDNKSFAQLDSMLRAASAAGQWLILVGHGIAPATSPYTTRLGVFQALLQRLARARSEIWVDTVEAVGSYLTARRSTEAP